MSGSKKPARVVFIGNSHLECLRLAVQDDEGFSESAILPFSDPLYDRPTLSWDGSALVYDAGYVDRVSASLADKSAQRLVACVTSAKHFELSMFELVYPIRMIADLESEHYEDGVYTAKIPFGMLVEYFRAEHEMLFSIFERIQKTSLLEILIPSFPPMPAAGDVLMKHAPPIWVESIKKFGMPCLTLRKALWDASTQALKELCLVRGFTFLAIPEESHIEGFARADMLSDGFHGNTKYGQLVLTQIRNLT